TLKEAISISGTLLMLDDATPHVAVVVQAVTPAPTGQSEPTVVATTLSDESGRYRFINLKPGPYQVRCYTKSGYVYYQQGEVLHVQRGKAFLSIDFRFAPFKKGVWRNYTPLDGLAFDAVNRIYVEPNGVMWFGTDGGGISRYDGKTFVNFTTEDGFSNSAVWAIHRNPDGVMWFGTWDAGVSQYDGKGFLNFTTQDGLAHNTVLTIDQAPDGAMWFGTSRGDISRYDGKAFINFPTIKEAFASNYVVRTLQDLRDSDGGLWVWSSWGSGVSRYDGKAVVNFTTADGLPSNAFRAIHREPDGSVWIGTTGGVSRYARNNARLRLSDGQAFLNITTTDGLVHNRVRVIHQDPDGIMWFGTSGGVSRYDGNGFANFTTKDGLASNSVCAIHRDRDGIIWFGTNAKGVSGYDGVAWTSLDTRDGVAGNTVRSISQAADGTLWFGTNGGMTRYQRSSTKPKVHIVSVTTDQTYHEFAAIPTMTIGTRAILAYNAIDFKTIPEKRQYRVRIIGDNGKNEVDWQSTKDAAFNHLFKASGTYTFEVVAIDRDLNYSLPASVTLKVVPPFYMTAVFLTPTVSLGGILLVGLTISLILLFKHRRRIRAYERLAVQELQDANRVQMSLMPNTAPPMEGVEIAGKCIPANTVSGDFFDYLQSTKKNEIGLVVADVCGKAMKGAMNAVMTDGILRTTAMEQGEFTSASLMMTLNNVLKGSMEWGMNVTMVIGMIDAGTKTLTLANAGHHAYPILRHNSNIQRLEAKGMPLGMRAGVQYREEQFPLQSGDMLILMTDGIIEAKACPRAKRRDNEENDYSESGRLEQTILQFTHDMPAEAMVEAIINDAIDYSGDKL
ncbi:SpoIIE family protein phosphatase, partial [bacterium]|nr:SpoIIE family protein phosphatase [bacterium]